MTDPKPTHDHPTREQIIAARGVLSQQAAGALIGRTRRCWQAWEAATPGANRLMSPALFDIFLLRRKNSA